MYKVLFGVSHSFFLLAGASQFNKFLQAKLKFECALCKSVYVQRNKNYDFAKRSLVLITPS
jgi:hypothetical protein